MAIPEIQSVRFLGRTMKRQSEIDRLLGEEEPATVLVTKARIVLRIMRLI